MYELPETPATLLDALDHAASRDGVGARFIDRHRNSTEWSFSELLSRATSAAGTLADAGVEPGDRVVIVTPTQVGFYDAFFGVLAAGAIPVPVYPPVRLGKMEEWVERTSRLVTRCRATAIIAGKRTRRVLGQVAERVELSRGILALENLPQGRPHRVAVDPDDIALVQFSSGTTRDPAPVALTHRQIIANIEAIVAALPSEAFEGGGCVSWLPLYHDMGLIGCLLTTLRVAQPMTLIPPEIFLAKPAIWLQTISQFDGTVSTAPNFAYARCVEKIDDDELRDVDLSRWVVAMNGAEPISVDVMRAFQKRFGEYGLRPTALSPAYGLAEAALAVTIQDFEQDFSATVFDRDALAAGRVEQDYAGIELPSLGRPLPGYEVEIRNDGHGAVGRIWVRGPSIVSGYLDGNDLRDDGWIDTGDLGFLRDGDLYVSGRAKDVVVVRGRNHLPHDLERACYGISGVRPGCAVAVSEVRDDGERVWLFVEAREDRPELADDCRSAIRATTGISPDEIIVLAPGTLPRTSSGKLRRHETLAQHLNGKLRAPRQVGPLLIAETMARSALGYLRR